MKFDEVLVLGGSGFIGRHLVAALVRRGIRVTVASRRRERAKPLILLPTVEVVEADINRPGVLERLARGQDALVNLVGVLHGDFARVHVELPLAAVSACRASGVKRLLHMSALGASRDAPSEYQRSKAKGEQAVLDADDLEVTVFRPSVIFGPGDGFVSLLATVVRSPAIVIQPSGLVAAPTSFGSYGEAADTLYLTKKASLDLPFTADSAGTYGLWIGGSLRSRA